MEDARIRALTARHPIKPTATRCPSAWQPNLGRGSTYRSGNSVQTTGTGSLALACLAVHGDIHATKTKGFRDAHEADWIIKNLEKRHPEFYPVPRTIKHVGGNYYKEGRPPTEPYFSKRDLLSLYGRSGAVLHRGNMRTIRTPLSTDFKKVLDLHNKIINLLAQHKIALKDGHAFLVTMASIEHNGEVFAVLGHEVRREKPARQT